MACDLGLGDDDMNRGSSQTGVCFGERGSPNARVGGLRICDKRTETGRREEATEGEREGAKDGDEEEEGKGGPAEIGWKTVPTHTLDLRFGDATGHAFCTQWSGSSSTTSKNCSKKSIFSTYVPPLQPVSLLRQISVETRCQSARDKSHAAIPHPGQGGLQQVRNTQTIDRL